MRTAKITAPADRSLFLPGGRVGFLLIHGLGGTPVEMRFVAQGLARAGHTVFCPQLAAHCSSELELKYSRWEQWYDSVEEAHDRLRRHCDLVIAGGLSMGGILALHLAAQRPAEVHGLALYAPTLWFDGWSVPWYGPLVRLLFYTRIRNFYVVNEQEPYGLKDERVRAFVVKHMTSGDTSQAGVFGTPVRSLQQFDLLVAAVRRELRHITAPALIVHPREDDISSLTNVRYLEKKLGGIVETVVLDDSYHMVTLDRQRHVVVDRSVAFAEFIAARNTAAAARPAELKHRAPAG